MAKPKPAKKKAEKPPKPELFIGSSAESLQLAHQLQAHLDHHFRATPWTAGVFLPSESPLRSLEEQLKRSQYGVFVLAKDDVVFSRHQKQAAVRDNVLIELGLFIGRLGSTNCYVVAPRNRTGLKIPSDLEGYTLVPFDDERFEENPSAATTSAATAIRNAISQRAKQAVTEQPLAADAPRAGQDALNGLGKAATDLLEMLWRGRAGLSVSLHDEGRLRVWTKVALKNILHVLRLAHPGLPKESYVAWLRPSQQANGNMTLYAGENLPAGYNDHYTFGRDEGLAGKVWATGTELTHSPRSPNPVWTIRPGCENESYVCVGVGAPAGLGGVLSLGSDKGFEPTPEDMTILKVFAGILAAATADAPQPTTAVGKAKLRRPPRR